MTVVVWRNVLIGAGAYFVSRLAAGPFTSAVRLLWRVVDPEGSASAALFFSPLLQSLPDALAATVAGVATALLVESDEPVRWTCAPAAIYLIKGFATVSVFEPRLVDLVSVIIGAVLPAVTCIAAGRLASWHRGLR
jgi:hypothetical protein